MWSADRPVRILRHAAALVAAAVLLGGCFTPMYGDRTAHGGSSAQAFFRGLDVAGIDGRTGVVLRNELIYLTQGGGGQPTSPSHVLRVGLGASSSPLLLDTAAGRPASQSITLVGVYTITPVGSGEVIHRGQAFAIASLDRTEQRFASDRAIIDAQERAAKTLAEMIVTQVAAWRATTPAR